MYIAAEESKKKFNVWGSFYNENGNSYRNVLDIAIKSVKKDDLLASPVDAVVIMLNPGSSRPVTEDSIQSSRGVYFCETIPDPAQYQIMSLMHHMNWSHVRVLNLSDIRDGVSGDFLEKLKSHSKDMPHSIFHNERSSEFQKVYNLKNNGTTILGWTLNSEICSLANLALNKGLINIAGLQHPDIHNLYRYPSPRNHNKKIEWLEEMTHQLKKVA